MSATLNQEEVSALMSAIQDGRVAADAPGTRGPVTPYDLTSQDRIIRGQMPTLDGINESIASLLGTGLAGRTRLSLRVSSTPATLLKFVDFNALLGTPSAVCVLALGPGNGFALVVLEPGLPEMLLAAALGDRKVRPPEASPEGRRELTTVEQLVLRRLLSILTDAMAVTWASVLPFKPEVLRFESDPRLAVIAPPNEVAIVTTFEIEGGINGRLQLVIPYAAVEPAKARLASPVRMAGGGDRRFAQALSRELTQVKVELRGLLGRATVPFSRLLELQVGDVLLTGTDEAASLPITVQGRLKMTGLPRVHGGSLALEIDRCISADTSQDPSRRNDGSDSEAA